ncbi:MAG: DUF1365 domain-containing protein [bacterium]
MVNNSCIYECTISHSRHEAADNKFYYKYFMFYLDLDEIDSLSQKLTLFSRNRFNVFNFRDSDHLAFKKPGVKQNILEYINKNGITNKIKRIQLLTNVATFGYNFNPVSFYFCFDMDDKPLCVVPEVGNTFGELKPYLIDNNHLIGKQFREIIQKNFYVSPFIEHDIFFDFQLFIPDEKLQIKIDDYKTENKIFTTFLSGEKKTLNNKNLIKYSFKYPFVTIKVIGAIHWQALKLIFKKVSYFKKNEFLDLQKGAIVKWKK